MEDRKELYLCKYILSKSKHLSWGEWRHHHDYCRILLIIFIFIRADHPFSLYKQDAMSKTFCFDLLVYFQSICFINYKVYKAITSTTFNSVTNSIFRLLISNTKLFITSTLQIFPLNFTCSKNPTTLRYVLSYAYQTSKVQTVLQTGIFSKSLAKLYNNSPGYPWWVYPWCRSLHRWRIAALGVHLWLAAQTRMTCSSCPSRPRKKWQLDRSPRYLCLSSFFLYLFVFLSPRPPLNISIYLPFLISLCLCLSHLSTHTIHVSVCLISLYHLYVCLSCLIFSIPSLSLYTI